MEGYRGEPRRGEVRREVREVQGRSKRNDRKNGKAGAKKQGGIGKRRKRYTGELDGIDMKTYLDGPVDFAKR